MAPEGPTGFDWQREVWRAMTSPRLRVPWLAMAVVAAASTVGCLWILAVNLPAALDGRFAGARLLQWSMVLFGLLGGTTTWAVWRLYRHSARTR